MFDVANMSLVICPGREEIRLVSTTVLETVGLNVLEVMVG